MKILNYISELIIPIIFFSMAAFGALRKVAVYDKFVEGAKDGLKTVVGILPTLIGLFTAVSMIRASGIFGIMQSLISPFTRSMSFPTELVPLVVMRLFSSSAAMGMLMDIFKNFGADSFIGRLASTIMGCTETVFYTMSVYFMSVGVKKTRYTLFGAIAANIAGVVASYIIISYAG